MSPKQIEFLRSLFEREGTRVWRDWPVSALLHEDFLDLQDRLEKVEATVDQALENGLFFFAVDKSHRGENLAVETSDKASEWLVPQCLLQGTPRLTSFAGPEAELHRAEDPAGLDRPRRQAHHRRLPPSLREDARRRQPQAQRPDAGRHGRRSDAAVGRLGRPQPAQEQLDRLRRTHARYPQLTRPETRRAEPAEERAVAGREARGQGRSRAAPGRGRPLPPHPPALRTAAALLHGDRGRPLQSQEPLRRLLRGPRLRQVPPARPHAALPRRRHRAAPRRAVSQAAPRGRPD